MTENTPHDGGDETPSPAGGRQATPLSGTAQEMLRGVLVFPGMDTDFLQQLELRGNNGARQFVETVYVLTGTTYVVPTHLHALDNPDLYNSAERSTVNPKNREMAELLARFYECRDGPRLIVRVHTHPTISTTPSDKDLRHAAEKKPKFDRCFDDYEFFLGIHGVGERRDPDPTQLRTPMVTDDHEVTWWGVDRKHKLAVFDEQYDPKPVVMPQR